MFNSLKEKLKNWVKKTQEGNENLTKANIQIKEREENTKKEKIQNKSSKDISNGVGRKGKEESQEKTINQSSEEKSAFFSKFKKTLTEEKLDELFEELEFILLKHNVALKTVESIKKHLKETLLGKELKEIFLKEELKRAIEKILLPSPNIIQLIKEGLSQKKPFVIVLMGINGSGKTTTTAKLAKYLLNNNFSICLAAADTFRAASIEQIQTHANSLNIPLIKKDYGSDPASVGFDAVTYAKKNKVDIVLIDTAGRMQNKDSLMKEIEKIARVTNPNMKVFVGESITGNDATNQAKAFNDAVDLSGIILTKADVDEKGGTAISVAHVTQKPILFLGTGQAYDDLEVFDKEKIIKKLGL